MDYALDSNGNRIYAYNANKSNDYYCPCCKEMVIPKQGSINEWHFAHLRGECSDSWHYDMSDWHKLMQNYFYPEHREIAVSNDGETHRADVLKDKTVVEFQHSPISIDEFCGRNEFWVEAGYRIVWVFDVSDRIEWEQIKNIDKDDSYNTFRWLNPIKCLTGGPIPQENCEDISICLSYTTEFGENGEHYDGGVYKILWASINDDGDPDYRFFKINGTCPIDGEFGPDMDMDVFFYKPWQWVNHHTRTLPRYNLKNCGIKGKPYQTYRCPIINDWIKLKYCDHCKYCGLIEKYHLSKTETAMHIYCCYPNAVRNDEYEYGYDENPNFKCGDVTRIER